MVAILSKDIYDGGVVQVLTVGKIDRNRVQVLLEQRFQFGLSVFFFELEDLQMCVRKWLQSYLALSCEHKYGTPFTHNMSDILESVF